MGSGHKEAAAGEVVAQDAAEEPLRRFVEREFCRPLEENRAASLEGDGAGGTAVMDAFKVRSLELGTNSIRLEMTGAEHMLQQV